MAVARDIYVDALTDLGVLSAGEVATAADLTVAQNALNRLIDQWAAEPLSIYAITRTTFTITTGTGTYTVGSGGDVNVARPVYIDHINYLDTTPDPDTEYPLTLLTDDGWANVGEKTQTSNFPGYAYYNPTFPLGTLDLWPVPTSTTLQGVLYAPAAVSELTSITQAISLPPGYRRMLVKNLALELAPAFEKKVDPVLYEQARESKAVVKRANKRLSDMTIEAGALGSVQGYYDIYSGP